MSPRAETVMTEAPRLASMFTSHMVLQQRTRVPVWGWAAPGEPVTVRFEDQVRTATSDATGCWRVMLEPLEAGGPFVMTVTGGRGTVRLDNVAVGEVWLASGQSNMEWPVSRADQGAEEIAASDRPGIRLFSVDRTKADEPRQAVTGAWQPCSPATVGPCSAVAYFFARDLHDALGVPIGIVIAAWDGSRAEAWTPRQVLELDPDLSGIVRRADDELEAYGRNPDHYAQLRAQWQVDVQRAEAAGRPRPSKLQLPIKTGSRHRPGCLFNGMVAPIIPYAIKGVIWYQGESNTGRPEEYRKLFQALIRSWRTRWEQGPFPFLFVQLANYAPRHLRHRTGTDRAAASDDSDWARLREAQAAALAEPRTGMAVAVDIGDACDIHPTNKQDVGRRLARAAEAIAYERPVVYSGPTYTSMTIAGRKAVIRFNQLGQGLCAKADPLLGFVIAGHDRRFVPAHAAIQGGTVEVWSPEIAEPVAVRYAWHRNPCCDLYNRDGLPAPPFRTDDWPCASVRGRHLAANALFRNVRDDQPGGTTSGSAA